MLEFALLNGVFVVFALASPVAGVLLLASFFRARRRGAARWPLVAAALVAFAVPLAGGYATFVEPFRLTTETVAVPLPAARAGGATLRVGVLADLQTDAVTAHERAAVETLLTLRPDVVLLPGDFFQGSAEAFRRELPALRALLQRLDAPGGVFAVQGNVDAPDELAALVAGTRVRWLQDEVVRLAWRDRRVTLGGASPRYQGGAARVIRELERDPDPGDVRLLLAHHPDRVLQLRPGSRIDLVVAGHTHGGQVQLPLIGPLLTFSRVPRRVAAGGLHDLDGRRIYVSRGVGWERGPAPRVRFLAPPEVSLLVLGATP